MDKCTRERIQIALMRSGITAVAGGALWFAAGWLATRYNVDLTALEQAGISVLAMLGAWFATKPMFSFTEECILMQEATTARGKTAQVKPAGKVFLPQQRAAAATPPARAVKAAKPVAAQAAALNPGKFFDRGRVTIDVARGENGATEVTVTARGLSASEFKGNNGNGGMRQKLENISGIAWQNPKNLGEGKRVMVGVVKSSNEGEVAAKLNEAAQRFAA